MKKRLLLTLLILFTISMQSQSSYRILGDWELVEINHNGIIYEPPSNAEIDNVFMRFLWEGDLFSLSTRVCGSIYGFSFPSSNDFILVPLNVNTNNCTEIENQEFQDLYFQFYIDDSNNLFFYTVIEDLGNGMRELEITNFVGNTATYKERILGIEEFDTHPFTFYPNPASATITIQNSSSPINSYAILDVSGRVIHQSKFESETIDVSALKAGMYFLEISSEGKKGIKKFVKK